MNVNNNPAQQSITPPAQNTTPPQQFFSDQEQHYKSLIELFKYSVTISISVFTLIGLVIGFLTYKDGQEMRDSQREARQEIRDNLKEMKGEMHEERERMEQKSSQARQELVEREKELLGKQTELEGSIRKLIVTTRNEVATTRGDAIKQIAGVKSEATTIARSEAKNSITEVFREKNLEPFIESVAKDKLEPKIQQLVDAGFKKATVNIEGQINETQLLEENASGTGNGGIATGRSVFVLDSLANFARSVNVRNKAKAYKIKLFNYIDESHYQTFNSLKIVRGDSMISYVFNNYPAKKAQLNFSNQSSIVYTLYNSMKSDDFTDGEVILFFVAFNKITNQQVPYLDYSALERVYNNYIKHPYPLKLGN